MSYRGSVLPKTPPPSGAYLDRRSRSRGAYTFTNAELRARYYALTEQMSELSATGLLQGSSWESESSGTHLRMTARHLRRACSLAAIYTVRCCCRRKKQKPRQPSKIIVADGLEASPSVDDLSDRWLVMPTGTWKEGWDFMILMAICYSAIVMPLRVGFELESEGWKWYFEVGMTFAFMLDVCFNFRTTVFDRESGKWITNPGAIASKYLRGWFWIDAPSSVPVEIIALYLDTEHLSMVRGLRMLRIVRLVKLVKIDAYMETLENYVRFTAGFEPFVARSSSYAANIPHAVASCAGS